MKIVMVGGGSQLWSPLFARDFCLHSAMTGTIDLFDLNPQALEDAAALYRMYNEMGGRKWRIRSTTNLPEALARADFVLVTINHGGLRGTKIDLGIPLDFGIPQTVGDTTGPGGLSRALRNVPAMVDIATAMQKHCPNAFLINLSNPMTVMCMAAARYLDPSRVIGYCHEWMFLREYLRDKLHLSGDLRLEPFIFGVNHFSAIYDLYSTPASVNMKTALRTILDDQEPVSDAEYLVMSPFENRRRVMHETAKTFGVFPIAGDRHIVEFMPGDWLTEGSLRRYGVKITTYEHREAQTRKQAEQYQKMLQGKIDLPKEHSAEEVDIIIAALAGLTPAYTTNVVVDGKKVSEDQMPYDPSCYYEATCHISNREGKPNIDLAAHLSQVIGYEPRGGMRYLTLLHAGLSFNVVHGILNGDRSLLVHALAYDPLTKRWLATGRTVEELVNELIAANVQIIDHHPLFEKLVLE